MSDELKQAYGLALIALLGREGPLADLVPLLERLDALTGLELHQKALPQGAPVIDHGGGQEASGASADPSCGPEAEDVTTTPAQPPVEHGRDEPADSPEGQTKPTVERGEAVQQANLPPHEEPQEASDDAQAPQSKPVAPPAPSPIPGARIACVDCGSPSSLGKTRCQSCANKLTWTPERRAAQSQAVAKRRASGRETFNPSADKSADTHQQNAPEVGIEDEPPTKLGSPTRGLSAIAANPPAEEAPADQSVDANKMVCTCLPYWRQKMQRFSEDVANEAHHENCAMYRKGAHRWPLPSATGDSKGPFVIQCLWCTDKREVDAQGIPWVMSLHNASAGEREATHV